MLAPAISSADRWRWCAPARRRVARGSSNSSSALVRQPEKSHGMLRNPEPGESRERFTPATHSHRLRSVSPMHQRRSTARCAHGLFSAIGRVDDAYRRSAATACCNKPPAASVSSSGCGRGASRDPQAGFRARAQLAPPPTGERRPTFSAAGAHTSANRPPSRSARNS